jgi:hypothetical protein
MHDMKPLVFGLFCCAFLIGCTKEVEPVKEKSKGDTSALSAVDDMTAWFLETYSSIEDGFAKAEKDLVESDRSPDQILRELHDNIGALASAAKAKRIELDKINKDLTDLKSQFEQLAISSPSSERGIYEDSLLEIDLAIEEKANPLRDFDFPYLEKFDSGLKSAIERWQQILVIMKKNNSSDFREKLSELIAKHFEDNLDQQIKVRRAKWSESE